LLFSLLFNPTIIPIVVAAGAYLVMSIQFKRQQKARWISVAVLSVTVLSLLLGWMNVALMISLGSFVIVAFMHAARLNLRLSGTLTAIVLVGSGLAYSTDYAFNNILKPHQQDRINVWLHPERCDPRGSLYNVMQSKMAIASGGIEGKGFLEGTMTKMNYVPEQSTDFIFCTVGEEQGFIGSFMVISLYLIFMLRIVFIAERQRSSFSRHYAYGVVGLLFIHFFVNIGMTMGLLPIIGIPLPLISKGGSALIGFTLMIAVLLKLDSNRYSL